MFVNKYCINKKKLTNGYLLRIWKLIINYFHNDKLDVLVINFYSHMFEQLFSDTKFQKLFWLLSDS